MLTVWGRTNSLNVQKVMWAIGELEIVHQRHDVGGKFGGLDTDAYRRLNPNRRIPVIEDGGAVVWESNAIVRYLAARYGEGRLWASDPGSRAAADQWMDWMQTTLSPDLSTVFWGLVRTPRARRDAAAIEAAARALGAHYAILDAQLDGKAFITGDSLTMADIPAGTTCYRYYSLPVERPRLANVEAWYARLQERPAYRQQVMVSYEDLRVADA